MPGSWKLELPRQLFPMRDALSVLLDRTIGEMPASVHVRVDPFSSIRDQLHLFVDVGEDHAEERFTVRGGDDITDRVAAWFASLPHRFRASWGRPAEPWPDCLPDMFDGLRSRCCLCPLLGYAEHEESCVYREEEPEVDASFLFDLPPMFGVAVARDRYRRACEDRRSNESSFYDVCAASDLLRALGEEP